MALRSICEQGYPLDVCRCHKVHLPLQQKPCPPGHLHRGVAVDVYMAPLVPPSPREDPFMSTASNEEIIICPRCEERVPHLRGSVCDFCADYLEGADVWTG